MKIRTCNWSWSLKGWVFCRFLYQGRLSTSILAAGCEQTRHLQSRKSTRHSSRRVQSSYPNRQFLIPPIAPSLLRPTNLDRIPLRPLSPSLPPTTQNPHAHNVRLNAHPAHSDRNLPTESNPPLRIRRRNPSSWRRSPRERGPKRPQLT